MTATTVPPAATESQVDAIYELNVEQVHSSDLNPRERYSADALKTLAKSIADDGLIQPIVVKRVYAEDGSFLRYEIVAGERRWRAVKTILKYPTIRATIVTGEVTDSRHKTLALIENLQREDLNPIEFAKGVRWLCETGGMKQKDVAKALKISAATVTNALQLLTLPGAVLARIETGTLSPTMARHLIPLADFPHIIDAYIDKIIPESELTTRDFEEEGMPQVWTLHREQLLVVLPNANPQFNWQKQCVANCPHAAYRATKRGQHICLRPDHFQELQAEAREKKEKADQRKVTKAQEKVRAVLETKDEDGDASPKQIDPKSLPKLDDLPHNSFVRLEYKKEGDLKKMGCSESCRCRGMALGYSNEVVPVCFDAKRHMSLQRAVSRQENKVKRAKHLKEYEEAATFIRTARVIPNRLLGALFRGTLRSYQINREKLATYLSDLGINLTVDDIRTKSGDIKLSVFSKITPVDLVRLVGWHMINEEYSQAKRSPDISMTGVRMLISKEEEQELFFDGGDISDETIICGEENHDTVEKHPGVCWICGCTDDQACEGGCIWMDDQHTLCSACVAKMDADAPDHDIDADVTTPAGAASYLAYHSCMAVDMILNDAKYAERAYEYVNATIPFRAGYNAEVIERFDTAITTLRSNGDLRNLAGWQKIDHTTGATTAELATTNDPDGLPPGWRIEQVEKRRSKRGQPVTLYRCVNDDSRCRTLTHSKVEHAITDIPNAMEFNEGDDTVDGITPVVSTEIEEVAG